MSVSDGMKANQISFNQAFLSRINDSDTIAKVDLKNESIDPSSGTDVLNIQRELNGLNSLINDTSQVNQPANRKPTWASNLIGSPNQAVKERVDSVQAVVEEQTVDIDEIRQTTGTFDGNINMGAYTPGANGFFITDDESTKTNIQELVDGVDARILLAEKGQPNGVATLDGSGLVPASQLPSFVDDVLEFANLAAFPVTGETGKIYVALDTNLTYRWSGSTYIEISANQVNSVNGQTGVVVLNTDDVAEGTTNLYFTDARADARADTRIAASSIDALADVDTTTVPPVVDQVLAYDGSNWIPADQTGGPGGGGASGTIYFSDRNADDIAFVAVYNDGGAVPTDGVGGTATVTAALETVNPIIGENSYRLEKGAGSKLGEGWAIDTDIPLDAPVVAGEPVTVQFRYRTSANYASGDVRMFAYFVGPNTLEALNGMTNLGDYTNELNAETGDRGQFTASVSCPATTTAIRIIGHIATTNALAYDIDIDEVTIGTAAQLISVEKREATISLAGSGSFTGGTVLVAKTGNQVTATLTTTATFSSTDIPTSAAGLIPTWARPLTGNVVNTSQAGGAPIRNVRIYSDGRYELFFRDYSGATSAQTSIAAGLSISYSAPETESNVISTTQAAFQGVKVSAAGNGGTVLTAGTTNIDWTKVSDPFGAWNGTVFTAPKKAKYRAVGSFRGTATVANAIFSYVNGTVSKLAALNDDGRTRQILWEGELNDQDQLSFRIDTTTQTLQNNTGLHWLEISEIPDLTVVGLAGQKREIVSTASPLTVITNSNVFQSFTGNSVPLNQGIWSLDGEIYAVSESNTIRFDRLSGQYGNTNASGSLTAPVTILTNSQNYAVIDNRIGNAYREILIPMPNILIQLNQNQNIFLNPQLGFSSGTNHRVLVRINAERLA